MIDLLVVGEINPDVIVTDRDLTPVFGQTETVVDGIAMELGSSSVITACGAARLGLATAFAGAVGDDVFGRFMLDEMARRGIDIAACTIDPTRPTGVSVLLNRGQDRAILTATGAMAAYHAGQVPRDCLRAARHLHVGSYYLQPALRQGLPELFADARSMGATTSLDCNWDVTGHWGGMAGVLAHADIFFLNSQEAQHLTGLTEPPAAARALLATGQPELTVIVKLGPDGALLVNRHTELQLRAPAVSVADTVGAGDSFNAGFLHGWLSGRDTAWSMRLAIACGSLSATRIGGTAGQPTLAQAREFARDDRDQ